jgi:hypothetical protein
MKTKISKVYATTVILLLSSVLLNTPSYSQTSVAKQTHGNISTTAKNLTTSGQSADLSVSKDRKKTNMPDWQWHKTEK